MPEIAPLIAEFGADPSAVRLLDDESPDLLPYATLLSARRAEHSALADVNAVYEWQAEPLMFLVAADSVPDALRLHQTRRLLAMRGDAPYLGVIAPGSLRVYRIALDQKSLRQAQVTLDLERGRSTVFPLLANSRPRVIGQHQRWISSVVLRLISESTEALMKRCGVSQEDAISLVGRALFTRFLADRNLLPEHMSDPSLVPDLFGTPEVAVQTSEWLDTTFNGDLLPLSSDIFSRLSSQTYSVLGNVLRRAPGGQLFLRWEDKWANLHFAHIPVGVLSQAYELHLKTHAPGQQKKEGGYFTPKPIADLMVRASFRALARNGVAASARVLDPAVGGGIFLLTAFRELVAHRWREDGHRPDTDTLRRILYRQLVGFDINEAALRFAALGLYLFSIELDPNPKPVDKLRFDNLRGIVLHQVQPPDKSEQAALGSLGPSVGSQHRAQYDLVIGNPPWSSGTHLPGWNEVRDMVARIANERAISLPEPPLPNEVLDLPFLWRAMEWAKPGGQIAFALHARLFFQQGDGMPLARQALIEALDITSVVNGVDVRETKVWPQISAPFCLLFANNHCPGVQGGFRFISPRVEGSLNRAGSMRIDVANSEVLSLKQLLETPEIFKVLFIGSQADLGILQRIRAQGHPTLADFWQQCFGLDRGHLKASGTGYQAARPSSRIRKKGDGLPGVSADYLHGLPELDLVSLYKNISLDSGSLPLFTQRRIHDPRSLDLFVGPQTIVHQSPPSGSDRMGVVVSGDDVVFRETFYGYSTSLHPDSELLARYLALVLGSKLALWFALVTSGKFGFERDVVEKSTLDRIPVPSFDRLTQQQRSDIDYWFNKLRCREVSWADVDQWVVDLYNLDHQDYQAVIDTLRFNSPYGANRNKAQELSTLDERTRFCEVLEEELQPWCDRFGSRLAVDPIPSVPLSPWQGVTVRTNRPPVGLLPLPAGEWAALLLAADQSAATELIFESARNVLLVGRLDQRRYWSQTQARLLAQRIAWTYVDALKGYATA